MGAVTTGDGGASRRALLATLLGSPPDSGGVLRVACNLAPSEGVGKGTWVEEVAASVDEAASFLARRVDQGDTYAALAWFSASAPKRKAGVIGKAWISVEVDEKSMPGPTPEQQRHQASNLARCLPCPAIIVASGGGYHTHLRLPQGCRVEDYTDPADGVAYVELVARALRLYLEDRAVELVGAPVGLDHVHGAERVWRIPPSWNTKAAGRPRELTADQTAWREVSLRTPGRIEGLAHIAAADLTFLTAFIGAAEDEVNREGSSRAVATLADVTPGGHSLPETSVATFQGGRVEFSPALLRERLKRQWPLDRPDQSDNDFAVAAALATDGWAPAVAIDALKKRRSLLKDPADREKGERAEYVRQTVQAAYERAALPTPPRSIHPFAPFPIDVLPLPVAEFVRAGQEALTCASEAIVLPLLTAMGAAIGNARRIQLKRTWSEPPLLWSCVIQSSGKAKSPAQELALRAHLGRQKRAFVKHRADMRRHAVEAAAHRRECKELERRGAGEAPPPPPRPVLSRLVVSEATIEAITPILEENQRGLLLVRDELSGWMNSFDAYRGGRGADREHWLSAHRAHPIIVDRKTEREVRFVEHGFIAVCGGTQPGVLRTLCTREAFQSGLVARLLLAWPDSPRKRWTDKDIPLETQQAVDRVFDGLLSLEMVTPTSAAWEPSQEGDHPPDPVPALVPLSVEALIVWRTFYDEFAIEQEGLDSDEALAAAFAKLEAYAARFALILEHVSWAASGRPEPPKEIGPEAMRAGVSLARWFAAEATRIYQLLAESDGEQRRARLIEWVAAQGHPVTVHELVRGPRAYRGAVAAATGDLEDLVTRGLAWRLPVPRPGSGGHPTRAYQLRAHVHPLERGDARSGEASPDKDLRERASPPDPESSPGSTA